MKDNLIVRDICINQPIFIPSTYYACTDVWFRDWKALQNFMMRSNLVGLLQDEFHIPQTLFYCYLQIRSYLNSTLQYKSGRKLNIFDNRITKALTLNKKKII